MTKLNYVKTNFNEKAYYRYQIKDSKKDVILCVPGVDEEFEKGYLEAFMNSEWNNIPSCDNRILYDYSNYYIKEKYDIQSDENVLKFVKDRVIELEQIIKKCENEFDTDFKQIRLYINKSVRLIGYYLIKNNPDKVFHITYYSENDSSDNFLN